MLRFYKSIVMIDRSSLSRRQRICQFIRCRKNTDTTNATNTTNISKKKRFYNTTSRLLFNDDDNDNTSLLHLPVTMFTDDENMIRDSVRQWSRNVLLPVVREMDNNSKYKIEILNDLFTNGYMGIEIPIEYGGSGLSFTTSNIIIEEISRIDPSVAILVDIHNTLINNSIRFWGTKDIQEQWLPKLATNTISSFCLSEADSGSDAFSMKTTATKNSDGISYSINGTKLWISNAEYAGVLLVFANVNPSLGYKGITAFVIDRNIDGISIGKPENKLGLCASSTCPITFDNVIVNESNILGKVGMGYKYCIQILNEGRIGIASQQLGIVKGCFDIIMPYIKERKQFKESIGNFQSIQHQYSKIAVDIYTLECMIYNTCRLKEHGQPFIKEACICKYLSSVIAERTASISIELLGGIGYTKSTYIEKFYRDCKVGSIYEGTSNIQLQTIAKILQTEYW